MFYVYKNGKEYCPIHQRAYDGEVKWCKRHRERYPNSSVWEVVIRL